uniref:Uncharacterized protein n=1 Tax=Candidatus Kentrum sp. FM TaxID=2126340 RepID=A0A450SWG1_9GAMM|nr:MAG: hypothetical protein BECKFM1743A_GA0114220_102054 [Candidatus Kentron sp. FM]VFJ58378.1 MAG: hypothetical protein BECKFM1743C_GA0114222_102224 [Candidatus Kentron sp. FM]VFK10667.1 MAG: hypothetical protein BECKFM1743B_GA0114221_101496 [Candidatus Kentron sp. FM]
MKHREGSPEIGNAFTLFSKLENETLKLMEQEWDYKKKVFGKLSSILHFVIRTHAIITFLLVLVFSAYLLLSIFPQIVDRISIFQGLDRGPLHRRQLNQA